MPRGGASRVPADIGGTLAGTYAPLRVRCAGTTVSPGPASEGSAHRPNASSATEAMRGDMEEHGADVETSTPEQLGGLVKSELAKWKGVVQRAKLTAE